MISDIAIRRCRLRSHCHSPHTGAAQRLAVGCVVGGAYTANGSPAPCISVGAAGCNVPVAV